MAATPKETAQALKEAELTFDTILMLIDEQTDAMLDGRRANWKKTVTQIAEEAASTRAKLRELLGLEKR